MGAAPETPAFSDRLLCSLNTIGRCATCPSLVGATTNPVSERVPAGFRGDCPDVRYGGVSERMPTTAPQGYTTFHEQYAVCGRDEVTVGNRVYPRTVSWRQIGKQLLRVSTWRNATTAALRTVGNELALGFAMVGAAERGDWVLVEHFAAGSYTVPPDYPGPPPARDALPWRIP